MPALTSGDLSKRLGVSARHVRELMLDDVARGLVVVDRSGRWQLTAAAEREFGHTLRGITELSTAPRRDGRPRVTRTR